MDIVSRIKQFIAISGLPTTQFADYAQIPRPTLSQILNGRNRKISNELIAKLHDAFPNLNIMWLMFGDGEPELKSNTQTSEGKNDMSLFDSLEQTIEDELNSKANEEKKNSTKDRQSVPETAKATPGGTKDTLEPELIDSSETSVLSTPIKVTPSRAISPGSSKKVVSIMVFYDDNSFETFTPAT